MLRPFLLLFNSSWIIIKSFFNLCWPYCCYWLASSYSSNILFSFFESFKLAKSIEGEKGVRSMVSFIYGLSILILAFTENVDSFKDELVLCRFNKGAASILLEISYLLCWVLACKDYSTVLYFLLNMSSL
jgi:hypothetical protein